MLRNASRYLLGLLLIGGAGLLSAAAPAHSATAVSSDPFSAVRVTPIAPNSVAPAFELKSLDGQPLRSQDFAGQVVLLNFWATWCGPCKDEMPSLARLQAQFDPKQLRVVTVTSDIHPQGIKQFLGHLGIQLPVLFDEDQELSRSFMVRGLPTTVLIAPNGHPIGRAVGPREWDSTASVALMRHVLEGAK